MAAQSTAGARLRRLPSGCGCAGALVSQAVSAGAVQAVAAGLPERLAPAVVFWGVSDLTAEMPREATQGCGVLSVGLVVLLRWSSTRCW